MYLLSFYVYLLTCGINGMLLDAWAPTVETPYGLVMGSCGTSYGGRKYEAYEGIPYALPPINERRFEPPQPIKKWNNILVATDNSAECIQYNYDHKHHNGTVEGKEDCLYLHIYVPIVDDRKELLPVVLAIHGGGLRSGSPYTNATFLMDRDIIFVSVNYRLGIFGFISTDDQHISGNMGLKDQSMALRWVSKNIRNFGGDPEKITLLGQSAGAMSVHYHYLSPWSKGLFQNGISLSGSALGAGKFDNHPLEKFQKLANLIECPVGNISETVACLRTRPAEEIAAATKHFLIWLTNPMNPFAPVQEKNSHEPFIDRNPIDIIESGDAADLLWIDSIVSEDGLFPGAEFIEEDTYLRQLDENWTSIAPHLLQYNFTIPLEYHDYYSEMIRKEYFGNERITKNNVQSIISLLTDRLFCTGGLKAAKLQAKVNKSPVLFWYYNYRALTSFSDFLTQEPKNFGVCHCDDLYMVVGNLFIDPPRRLQDRAVQTKLLDLLLSVATEGYPNVGQNLTWENVNADTEELELLHFSSPTNMKMESRSNFCNHEFWDEIDAYEY